MQQTEMPFMGATRKLVLLDEVYIQACPNLRESVRLCINLSSLTNIEAANKLGIDRGNFSRIMSGNGNFPLNKLSDLMLLCGNYAPLQFLARQCGFVLVEAEHIQAVQKMLSQMAA